MNSEVILVDQNDLELGRMDKMEAHRKGVLHRAFSVFIFDGKGKMLLQQRAVEKYHGGLLWTNACCSHPFPDEETGTAAARRLNEEMGFSTPIEEIFHFIYHAHVENGLIEHEFDHVFAGEYEGKIFPDPNEVSSFEYREMKDISTSLNLNPDQFTSWFRIAFPRIEIWWKDKYGEEMTDGR